MLDLAYSPDGSRLLTAQASGALVWDTRTGQPITALAGSAEVSQVHYSPDSHWLLVVGQDGVVRQYAARVEDVIALLAARLNRHLTEQEQGVYSQTR